MKRRPFPVTWSPNFAYAIGLIASDGNLSSNGRHITFTSKDYNLAQTFKDCLNLKNKIGLTGRGTLPKKQYFHVQFGSKTFYEFLNSIGLFPRKSKTIAQLSVPREFFADFLRGCIDGDGCIDSYKHPESQHPQLRIRLASASKPFLTWVHEVLLDEVGTKGGSIYHGSKQSIYYLQYNKADSFKILRYIYSRGDFCCLARKYQIALPFLRI